MENSYIDSEVISNKEIAPGIYKMEVRGKFEGKPGQFYMLRAWKGLEPLLARPISISNLEVGKITFLYQEVGRGTSLMADLKSGDYISSLGPLGNGFEVEKIKGKTAIVSGGIGIAPLLYLAKELERLKIEVDIYSGFKEESYYLDEFKPYVQDIKIATESGKIGHNGMITEILDIKKYENVMLCGPIPMINQIIEKSTNKFKIMASMESRMACGIGACLGCTIETTKGKKRVCADGPVFNGEELYDA